MHPAPDTVVVISPEPMGSADPAFAFSLYEAKLTKLVYVGLTALDTDDLVPRLALAARIDHVDPLTVDVTLRADARFSDGAPVLARDVAATYGGLLAPTSTSLFHRGYTERFTAVEAIGDRVARFHLVAPLATLEADLDFGIVSATTGLGAGPYVVVALDERRVLLDANRYATPPPRTPHVELRVVRNDAARMLLLAGGGADLAQNAIRPDLVDELRARGLAVHAAPSSILTYLMMQNRDPALADVRVRRAIAYALDRPAIVAAKFGGRAALATGMLPAGHWAYAGDVARYDRDLARARALLAEAGYGPTHPLRLEYKTSTDAFRIAVAKVIAAQLGEAGIAVDLRSYEFATFFADVKRGNYQLASMQSGEITEPDLLFNYFHSSRIPVPENPDAGNRWRYWDPALDALVDAGRHVVDRSARRTLYAEAQRILAADVPVVPLWHEDNVVVATPALAGFRITPTARLNGLATTWKTAGADP